MRTLKHITLFLKHITLFLLSLVAAYAFGALVSYWLYPLMPYHIVWN